MRLSHARIPAVWLIGLMFLVSTFFPPTAAAQNACKPLYEAAITALDAHAAGMVDRQNLHTKVENARQKFRFQQPTENALQQLDVALGIRFSGHEIAACGRPLSH